MAVTTITTTLGELVKGRRVEIPPIQRDYSWKWGDTSKKEDVSAAQLWEDLKSFHDNNVESNYFLGGMISWVETDDPVQLTSEKLPWRLLDGQQRLTS